MTMTEGSAKQMLTPYSEYSPAVRYGRHKLGREKSSDVIKRFHEWTQTCAKICPDSVNRRIAEEEQANYDEWLSRQGGEK